MPPEYAEMKFPVAGIDLSRAFCNQSPRPLPQAQWTVGTKVDVVPGVGPSPQPQQVYGRTCAAGVNVRGFEATQLRRRGGSRPGLSKFVGTPLVAGCLVQGLATVAITDVTAVPANQMGRVVYVVGTSQGYPFYGKKGDLNWTAANNASSGTPPLTFSGRVFSATNGQKIWYADGTNYVYFDPRAGTVYDWTASAGSLPADSANNKPRLICNWRGRIVLAGLFLTPQGLFMSAVDDPTNWDYAPLNYTPTQAFATTLGPQNSPGAPISCLMPFNDDVLFVGCDHELWVVNGDPQAGGQISLLTKAIGTAYGEPWTQSPDGTIWFVSNKMGIYSVAPGQMPQRISQPVEALVQDIDTGVNSIKLAWSDRFQTLRIFVTPLAGPGATTHYAFEPRTGAWWQDTMVDHDMDPLAVCEFDGNTETERTILIGSWDGYVRQEDGAAATDDGEPINSSVTSGPLVSQTLDEMRVDEMVTDLGETSGNVTWEVLVGTTAEAALSSTAVASGTLTAGRNSAQPIRRAAHAVYLRHSATVPWSYERSRLRVTDTGPTGPRARRK